MEAIHKCFLVSSIGFCILVVLGCRSNKIDFDDCPWGERGVLIKFLNLEIIIISLGVDVFMVK